MDSSGFPQQKHTQTPSPRCPECGSQRIWKDGIRYANNGQVQRFLCRSCGRRFSDSKVKVDILEQPLVLSDSMHDLGDFDSIDISTREIGLQNSTFSIGENIRSHNFPIAEKSINNFLPDSRERQVCVDEKKMKNLVKVEARQKQAAGATMPKEADLKGKSIEFLWFLKKKGYAESTVVQRVCQLKLLVKEGADLYDADSVKMVIAAKKCSNSHKSNLVHAYTSFLSMEGGKWEPPNYQPHRKLPFIPLEKEIDALIAGCSKKVATTLQLLKETGMRIGEAWRLRWIDIDERRSTIRCEAEKHGNPRMFKISSKLLSMLKILPRKSQHIFNRTSLSANRTNFIRQRKQLARKLQNPRLLQITFHTLRHWKATMEYHRTKDILHVMQMLGHRNIQNTLIYTQLIEFEEQDDFHSATAKSVDKALTLIETGFEYVCEMDGVKLFRKRK